MSTQRLPAGGRPTVRTQVVQVDPEKADEVVSDVQGRYIADILRMHGSLSYGTMFDRIGENPGVLYKADHGNGLVTIAARTHAFDGRHLLGISGFRLSEYLRAGFASKPIVFERRLFVEPRGHIHPDDVHVVTISKSSGRIAGYVALTTGHDADSVVIGHQQRKLFPFEEAHSLHLGDLEPSLGAIPVNRTWEIKRLVHSHALTGQLERLQVTLELLCGISAAVGGLEPGPALFVGDVERHVALRHLVLLGLDVVLVEGTTPRLPRDNVMYPLYSARDEVLPFYAPLPDDAEVCRRTALVEEAASSGSAMKAVRTLMSMLSGTVVTRRVEEREAA